MPDSIRLDARSATACDMTVWGDRLQLAWTGRDYRLRLGSTFGLTPLEGERKLRYTSYRERSTSDSSPMNTTVMPPSVAGVGDRLLLAWTASNWSVWLVAADPSSDFHAIPVKERSWLPSVVVPVGGDRSILSWIGTDRRINLLELKGERPERSIRLDNAKSDHRPAVCRHGHGLTVAWTGGDRRVNVLGVESGRPGRQDILRDARTGAEPAISSHDGRLYLAWTGGDRRVNLLCLDDGGRPVRLDDVKSDHGPSLCSYQGDLLLAWTGSDGRVNLRRLAG
jgi:hypothetical protein